LAELFLANIDGAEQAMRGPIRGSLGDQSLESLLGTREIALLNFDDGLRVARQRITGVEREERIGIGLGRVDLAERNLNLD
jgi:hypothetical protein